MGIQENIYEQEEDITDVEEKIVEFKFISAEEKRCQGVLIDDSCFFLGKHQYDFDTSVLDCRKDGAELARISNLRTFTAVHSYMLNADHITDKSGLFAWTGLANEDNDEESADQQEWLSGMFSGTGFPEAKVMWQVMSDLYFSKQDGFVYAPKEATGYPLCAYEIRSFPEGPTTTTVEPMRPTRSTEKPMRPTRSTEEPTRPTIFPARSTTTNGTPARPTKPLDPLRPTRNPNITERSSSLDQDPYVSCPRGEKECDSETICTNQVHTALRSLERSSSKITGAVTDYYSYTYDGENSYEISNGGNDMFDHGNKVFINAPCEDEKLLFYNKEHSYTDFEVGSVASQPFHTLMWIADSSYESQGDYYNITVSGRTGTEGDGRVYSSQGEFSFSNGYKVAYIAHQVYAAANHPSICEVFYTISNTGLWGSSGRIVMRSSVSDVTNVQESTVLLDASVSHLYFGYTLLSKETSRLVRDSEIQRALIIMVRSITSEQ